MDGPPPKRARRADSAAMWDKNDTSNRGTASPRSPRPQTSERDEKPGRHEESKRDGQGSRRDDDTRRRRSRSPRERHDRSKPNRSRSPREREHRDRDRDRDRDRIKEEGGRRDRSRDRHRSSRADHKPERRRDRSRSPHRNGDSTTSGRYRSPPRSRIKEEDRDSKRELKDVKPATNGTTNERMDVDESDLDGMMKRMMGFSTFKSTQNTKVPGNDVYGVRKEKKTEYRQYMNRVGGFNRPLSPG